MFFFLIPTMDNQIFGRYRLGHKNYIYFIISLEFSLIFPSLGFVSAMNSYPGQASDSSGQD